MATPSYILKSDALARHQKQSIDLIYNITGAKAGSFAALPPRALVAYDNATAPSQADINALLGSTLEFTQATVFGSTALGTDALAMILDCEGQIAAVHGIKIHALTDDGAGSVKQATQLGKVAALSNGSLAAIARVEKSAQGNLGVQLVVTELDAATSGQLQISILVDLK